MERYGNMSIPVQSTIAELTPTAVARAMGFPISTVFRWMNEDRIPGRGTAHKMRREKFEEAAKRLKADQAKPSKPRKVAA